VSWAIYACRMTIAGTQVAMCSVCGQVKEGPIRTVRPSETPPPFVCSDCLKKQEQSA
jgi:hypothetical protein